MADIVVNVIALLSLAFLPLVCSIVLIVILAFTGTSLGIRKAYLKLVLKIFDYGKQRIEKAAKKRSQQDLYEESEDSDGSQPHQDDEGGVVINRENKLVVDAMKEAFKHRMLSRLQDEFNLMDGADFCKLGIEAVIEDEVTKRFAAEELPSWNLLTRTNFNYQYISLRLTILWGIGFLVRYFVLLPIRVILAVIGTLWLLVATAVVGYWSEGSSKHRLNAYVSVICYRILARSFSAIITLHNTENEAKPGGICVANHTSPIDVIILSCSNCYAMVGQKHGGFFGLLQQAMYRASDSHIWFERSEAKDRGSVAQRLRSNVADLTKMPILIFPEGTCINNTSVMQFKKGSFEAGGIIYPAAIKYDPRFGDPFWNSSKQGMIEYLIMMMTSWAIVCDVWFLPPMTIEEGENSIDFANRVKGEIAKKGGLVDLVWDGQLKRMKVKESWRAEQQKLYSQRIKVD